MKNLKIINFYDFLLLFYIQNQIEDLLEGVVNEEALEKLEKKKVDHKGVLSIFRDEFDEIYKKEKHLKNEIKAKKAILSNFVNFKELLKNHMNPDDKQVLDLKE